jgi:hypothetical protein
MKNKVGKREVQVDGGLLMALYLSTLVNKTRIGRGKYSRMVIREYKWTYYAPYCGVGHIRDMSDRSEENQQIYKECNSFGEALNVSCLENVNDTVVKQREEITFETWLARVEKRYNVSLVPV